MFKFSIYLNFKKKLQNQKMFNAQLNIKKLHQLGQRYLSCFAFMHTKRDLPVESSVQN